MQAVVPRAPALRFGEALIDVVLQLHAGDMAQHDAGDMGRRRGIRVAGTRITPERDVERRFVEIADVLAGDWLELLRLLIFDVAARRLAFAPVARRHAKELAERDAGLARIVEREGFRQILFGENLGVEPGGYPLLELMQHDAARDAAERLARGGHVGIRVAAGAAEVALENEVPFPHDQQPAIRGGALGDGVGRFQLREIHVGEFPGVLRGLRLTPSAFAVGRRKINVRSVERRGGEDARKERRGCEGTDSHRYDSGAVGEFPKPGEGLRTRARTSVQNPCLCRARQPLAGCRVIGCLGSQ